MLETTTSIRPDWADFGEAFDVTALWHDFHHDGAEDAECLAYYDIEYQDHWNGRVTGSAYLIGLSIEERTLLFLDRDTLMTRYGTPFIDAAEEAIDEARLDQI